LDADVQLTDFGAPELMALTRNGIRRDWSRIDLAFAAWRRLLVVSTTSIAEFHEILQSAFGWSDEHLHRFLIHGTAYGIPHLGGIVFREDARGLPLYRFRLHFGERFRYEYDFTADWKLDIRLELALPFDPKRALPF
jgi:Plasmid pRiA4b ORF-3-like protein